MLVSDKALKLKIDLAKQNASRKLEQIEEEKIKVVKHFIKVDKLNHKEENKYSLSPAFKPANYLGGSPNSQSNSRKFMKSSLGDIRF